MSKQAMGEIIKAASLVVTAIIYLFLLSALITPSRAFASERIPDEWVAEIDQQKRQPVSQMFNKYLSQHDNSTCTN